MKKTYRSDDKAGAPDAKGAVESQMRRTRVIKGDEVLGYDGAGREEHSGQNSPGSDDGLADNRKEDCE
ncbi:MAG TPA: hypothetical protein VMS56_16305 [Thermoanaerobaculia bacterium]|nr:hypothetical protein [Thermoanaerobaculia bacterium]